ncbi:MAG TPA: ATP-binding protein [Rhizomicrobium sp.]|nr:ATP-binding protein [Rhizomicrobium sp.]
MLGLATSRRAREALSDSARQQLRSYGIILGIFLFLLAMALFASWGVIGVIDATRAYVTGESRYSKAEKIAVLDLHRYAYSQRPEDYARFLAASAILRGAHAARIALEKAPPDFAAARTGFLAAGNTAADADRMIALYRRFSWWKPLSAALEDWRDGDRLVTAMTTEAAELHYITLHPVAAVAPIRVAPHRVAARRVTGRKGRHHSRKARAEIRAKKVQPKIVAAEPPHADVRARVLDRIDRLDDRLTELETRFSAHLGDAARAARLFVLWGLGAITALLCALGSALATRMIKRQLALGGQLHSSEQRFRDFADVASDWYWEMDTEGRLTYVSERFGYVIDSAPESLIGEDADAFIRENVTTPEHREAYLNAVLNAREFRGIEVAHKAPDGTVRYWSISAKPNLDAEEVFLGYRGVGSDITAIVLDAQMLREAKARAEAANCAKSQFLANMSHELRTPLNAILGFSDIIAQQSMGPDAVERYVEYAEDIHKSGRHLLAIIDDILDLAKIEAGHAEISEREVELPRFAKTLETLLGHRFVELGIDFRIDLPKDVEAVRVDERKFAQLLLNLLSNALKFTPRGGSVSLSGQLGNDGSLVLCVRDTGIGIAAQDIATVLTPFGQVESAFSRKHHGTGLGLPLARSIAELHGGSLTLESAPNAGTTVTVILPRQRVVAALARKYVSSVA